MNPLRVLIAEDDRGTAEELQGMIQRWGYGLAGTAQDRRDVVANAESLAPDLVLLNAKLPGLDGKVKAIFKNGVLEIHLPKTKEAKGKRIEVKVE